MQIVIVSVVEVPNAITTGAIIIFVMPVHKK